MRFGIKTSPQHTTWADMLAVWQAADDIELFESGWTFDHFYPIFSDSNGPCLEGWITLTALAQATERLRVGVLVTGNVYRHPAVLANMAATLDIISNGRLELGPRRRLERGGVRRLRHRPAAAQGAVRPLRRGVRGASSACCRTRPPTSTGKHYRLTAARCEPKPVQRPHPPIVHRRRRREAHAARRRPLRPALELPRRRRRDPGAQARRCSRSTAPTSAATRRRS